MYSLHCQTFAVNIKWQFCRKKTSGFCYFGQTLSLVGRCKSRIVYRETCQLAGFRSLSVIRLVYSTTTSSNLSPGVEMISWHPINLRPPSVKLPSQIETTTARLPSPLRPPTSRVSVAAAAGRDARTTTTRTRAIFVAVRSPIDSVIEWRRRKINSVSTPVGSSAGRVIVGRQLGLQCRRQQSHPGDHSIVVVLGGITTDCDAKLLKKSNHQLSTLLLIFHVPI